VSKVLKSRAKLRAWGNSIGIILPKGELSREHLHIDDEVEVFVRKKANPLKDTFGKLKEFRARSGKSTDETLREIDKELESRLD